MRISLVAANANGEIYDHPDWLMVMDRGGQWSLPSLDDLIPLPEESELFLLPDRQAAGFDPATGEFKTSDYLAVAAFAAPGYTLTAHPAYVSAPQAPLLPLFAYGAVGFWDGQLWIAARKVDEDARQIFSHISAMRINAGARKLLATYPQNRLVRHIINNCVRRYDCPAARNFALGRYEAPLPTSRACNAACIGCISFQAPASPVKVTPQCRLDFTPQASEIAQVMAIHEQREKRQPIYSFGQGCEGDPLMNYELLCESIGMFRGKGGKGTINCNTNASRPNAVGALVKSGLTSMRVSLNSAVEKDYLAYYRPTDYTLDDVKTSIATARSLGAHVSLNLLYFPGYSDTRPQQEALARLCASCGVSMIQLRNLNIDPAFYRKCLGIDANGSREKPFGLKEFMEKMTAACPWLRFGYFNPYLGEKAVISAPFPQ